MILFPSCLLIQINGNELGSVIVGRNIAQCSVNSCVSSPCQNGGSCISTGVSYTCVCSLGFGGSVCENGMLYVIKLILSYN